MRCFGWFVFVGVAVALGCGGGSTQKAAMPAMDVPGGAPGDNEADAGRGKAAGPDKTVVRKIIYTAKVTMKVADLDRAHDQLRGLLDEDKDYIASSNISGEKGSYRVGTWVVRIPVSRYRTFLDGVKKLGEVSEETSTAEDVSEEFHDLEARLKNKRVEEERLLQHLKDSTGKLEEILAVEAELSRVRGEIERAEGRRRYLTNRTDFTTVTVSMTELTEYEPASTPGFGTQTSRTWSNSMGALWRFLQTIALVMVALVPWLPVIVVGVFGAWWLMKWGAGVIQRLDEQRAADSARLPVTQANPSEGASGSEG